jgi:phosphatidylglycerophosphate synthase
MFGALIGLIGGVVFYYGHWWPGLVLLLVRGLVDHIDGFKARNFNQRSTFGAVMDDVCDRWVLGIMYAGGCLNLSYDYPHILIVLGFGITGSLTNVLIKIFLQIRNTHHVSSCSHKTDSRHYQRVNMPSLSLHIPFGFFKDAPYLVGKISFHFPT